MHAILGNRFQQRGLPWHRAAVQVPPESTALSALRAAGMDFTVEKTPLSVQAFGQTLLVPDRFALVRPPTAFDPQPATLGIVGPEYTILQYADLAQALDSALQSNWALDSIGLVNAGQKMFISLSAGKEEIGGEPIDHYFLLVTGHDGLTATTAAFTPVNVSCTNAMLLGVRQAALSLHMVHGKSIRDSLLFQIQRLGRLTQLQEHKSKKLLAMTLVHLSPAEQCRILDSTFPSPARPRKLDIHNILDAMAPFEGSLPLELAAQKAEQTYRNAITRSLELRTTTQNLLGMYNTAHPKYANTAWALYQAITELCCHREGHQRQGAQDNVSISTLFGPRAAEMGRAWAALSLAVDRNMK